MSSVIQIIEPISEQAYLDGEKLLSYMNIPSLKAYLLVEQNKPEVEFFYRKDDGDWWVESFEGLEAVIKLPCSDMELTLADIYESIQF